MYGGRNHHDPGLPFVCLISVFSLAWLFCCLWLVKILILFNIIPGGFNNYKTPKAFHTTLVPVRLHKAGNLIIIILFKHNQPVFLYYNADFLCPQVSVAPTNMIQLDHYYNSLQENKDKYDSIQDTNRRTVPEDSPTIGQSLKDLFFPSTKSNRRVIKIKKPMAGLPSTTLKPFFTTLSTLKDKLSYTDKKYSQSFPYVFQKPIEAPSSR